MLSLQKITQLQCTCDNHKYYFKIEGHPEIKILRPKKPFKLRAGKKAQKVVVLSTEKVLVKNDRKDTPIPITIKAFAVDDPEHIFVERQTTFVFPRYDLIKKHQN